MSPPSADQRLSSTPDLPSHRDRNVISAVVGVVAFLLVWALAIYSAGLDESLPAFVNLPSVVVVVLAPAAILLTIYGWAGVVDACAFVARKPDPGPRAQEAAAFFQLAAAFAMACGFLATVVGLVAMLVRLDDPGRIGPGMAVALLSQLYGVFLAVACIAASAVIARRHGGAAALPALARRSAGVAGIAAVAGTLTTLIAFAILMLALAPGF